jgi:ligand-binding SRPBCC domain-containing protein
MPTVTFTLRLPVPASRLLEFHRDAGALAKITPGAWALRLQPPTGKMVPCMAVSASLLGLTVWKGQIDEVLPDGFVDSATNVGAFRTWQHRHRISGDEIHAVLEDIVSYEPKPFLAGVAVLGLRALFAYRHWRTAQVLR